MLYDLSSGGKVERLLLHPFFIAFSEREPIFRGLLSYILKAEIRGIQIPRIVFNFLQKDYRRRRKLSVFY